MHVVLVHGTTQSPQGWQLLTDELTALGHTVVTVDLAVLGESLSPTEYGKSVRDQVGNIGVDIVAAHSGSGLLLPAIAAALDAACQCFVAAFIPDGVRSLVDEVEAEPDAVFHSGWIGVDPTVDEDAARRFLFHDCTPSVTEWAMTTLRRFVPVHAYSTPAPVATSARAISIVPRSDRTLRSAWMIAACEERLGIEPIVVPGGHCPHVSRPRQIARIMTSSIEGQ